MMGILRGANFPVNSCLIPPRACLLIFSDGVFEIWRDKHTAWDWPACVSYLATLSQGAETVLDELIAHVRLLRGSHQLADDFSIIESAFRPRHIKKGAIGRPFDHGSMPVNPSLTLPVCVVSRA
jgi:serine phosphatase RsbU (regulator of sigma subunit)